MSLSGKIGKVADSSGVWGPIVAKVLKALVQRVMRRRAGKSAPKPAPEREAYVDPTASAIAEERAKAEAQYGRKP